MRAMIEDGRTGLTWRKFMSNGEMVHTQDRIGFQPEEGK